MIAEKLRGEVEVKETVPPDWQAASPLLQRSQLIPGGEPDAHGDWSVEDETRELHVDLGVHAGSDNAAKSY